MRRIVNSLFLVFLMAAPAAAQAVVTTPLDPSETYIPIIQFRSSEACFVDGFCITERSGISISSLATVNQLNAVSTRIDNLVTTLAAFGPQLAAFDARLTNLSNQVAAINNTLVTVDNRLATIEDDLGKALEGAALATAVKDAIPYAGDRFALRLNAAGAGGEFAGAVSFAYAVAERARVHFNYGRSESLNAFSGGVNLSFR